MSSDWDLDNPAFVSFVFYSAVLALKVLAMSFITGYYRMSNGAFANPEDAKTLGAKAPKTCPDVERVRRAHQNDIENIPVFFVVASLYLLTDPSAFWATMLFRVFTISRIIHSVLYLSSSTLRPVPYLVGQVVNIYMIFCLLCRFW